jgi:hypothetical protein
MEPTPTHSVFPSNTWLPKGVLRCQYPLSIFQIFELAILAVAIVSLNSVLNATLHQLYKTLAKSVYHRPQRFTHILGAVSFSWRQGTLNRCFCVGSNKESGPNTLCTKYIIINGLDGLKWTHQYWYAAHTDCMYFIYFV